MLIPKTPVHHTGDVSIFTAGGSNLICDYENVQLTLSEKQEDGSCLGRDGEDPQGVKRSGKLTMGVRGNRTGGNPYDRTSHIDVSSILIGADDYIRVLKSVRFGGTFTKFMQSGVGEWWERPQNHRKAFAGNIVLEEGDDVAAPFLIAASSNDANSRNTTLSIVIGGQTFALPIRFGDVQTGRGKGSEGGQITVPWVGRDPGSGAYPTAAPAGTTGLFGKVFNDWRTPFDFAFASRTTHGWSASGKAVFDSFGFDIQDGVMIPTNYEASLYGRPTIVAN